MSNDRHDDLEPALRAMLGDHHLDVRPRGDAVDTVLAGVGRARRRRTTGYAAVSTFAVTAATIGAITLTGSGQPQGYEPVQTPTATATPTTLPSLDPPPTADLSPLPPPSSDPTSVPVTTPPSTPPPTAPTETVAEVLRPTGIGDVDLRMTPTDAYGTDTLAMFDPYTGELIPWDGSQPADVCNGAGRAQRTTPDQAGVFMTERLGVVEIILTEPGTQTVDGVAIGMDLDEALAMYPDVRTEVWGDPADGLFWYFVDDWLGSGNELEIRWDGAGPRVVDFVMLRVTDGMGCYE